jgi:hypothetical protein
MMRATDETGSIGQARPVIGGTGVEAGALAVHEERRRTGTVTEPAIEAGVKTATTKAGATSTGAGVPVDPRLLMLTEAQEDERNRGAWQTWPDGLERM